MSATCEACGQPLPESEAPPEPPRAPTTVLECLTPGERARNARHLWELSPERQKQVRAALGLKAARV